MEWILLIVLAIFPNAVLYVHSQQLIGESCLARDINEDLSLKLRQLETSFLSYQSETQRKFNALESRISELELEKQANGDNSK